MEETHVELKLAEMAGCADDIAKWLYAHPAEEGHKVAALLFLYVVSQAQLPSPQLAVEMFTRSTEAIRQIVEAVYLEQQGKRQTLADSGTANEEAN